MYENNVEVLEIKCVKCNHIGMEVKDYSDHKDCYKIQCTECGYQEWLNEHGYDNYYEGLAYQKAMNANKDVTVLNKNGSWVFKERFIKKGMKLFHRSRLNKTTMKFENYTEEMETNISFQLDFSQWINEGWEKFAEIDFSEDSYEIYYYFRKGLEFIKFEKNCLHNTWVQCDFRVNEGDECMNNLINHFVLGK